MYIKKGDYIYFENLYKGLDKTKKDKFINALLKSGKERIGEDISKIKIIDENMLNLQGIEQSEIVTRTMIKKAYKTAKEENTGEKID